jgi:hypothetical protein
MSDTLDIPTEPKAFSRWLFANKWYLWPKDLRDLADRTYQALVMSEHASEAWRHSDATRRLNAADWSAFTTAYAEHRRAQA